MLSMRYPQGLSQGNLREAKVARGEGATAPFAIEGGFWTLGIARCYADCDADGLVDFFEYDEFVTACEIGR